MTIRFDLGRDLDLEFSRSNIEFAISRPKMVRLPRNEKQTYRLNSRPQMWPMVWIYQIVTGVTSVVGVPSTHLVRYLQLNQARYRENCWALITGVFLCMEQFYLNGQGGYLLISSLSRVNNYWNFDWWFISISVCLRMLHVRILKVVCVNKAVKDFWSVPPKYNSISVTGIFQWN